MTPVHDGDVRAELLAAGERVFADRGYEAATVDDVVRSSGTSRASFYRYFNGKYQLFDELSRECFREMRAVIRAFADLEAPVDRRHTVALLERYHELHARYGGVVRAWTELTGPPDSPLQDSVMDAVRALSADMERALAKVVPHVPEGDRGLRAAMLFLLIERSSFYVSNRVSRVDRDRLPPTLATLVHRGYLGGAASGGA